MIVDFFFEKEKEQRKYITIQAKKTGVKRYNEIQLEI